MRDTNKKRRIKSTSVVKFAVLQETGHQMCSDIADGLVRVDARDLECDRRSHARFDGVCDRLTAPLGAASDCERIDELVCD